MYKLVSVLMCEVRALYSRCGERRAYRLAATGVDALTYRRQQDTDRNG